MKTKFYLIILTSFLLFSCAISKKADEKLKNKLIGNWSGSETGNQKSGLTKHWIQQRNKNGTFIVLFTSIENCEVETHIEKGKWKVKDEIFYETFDFDGKTDIYSVEIIDDNTVKYKAKELIVEFNNTDYEFTETREE